MIDINKLKGEIKGRGLTQADVADGIGLKHKTFNAQINKGILDSDVIESLVLFLELDKVSAMAIFFPNLD